MSEPSLKRQLHWILGLESGGWDSLEPNKRQSSLAAAHPMETEKVFIMNMNVVWNSFRP